MGKKRSTLVRALLIIVVLVVVALVAGTVWLRKNPLAAAERATRKALVKAGLERTEVELVTGRMVYWQGGEGPLLVLVHGAGHQAGTWSLVVGELMTDYRLVIPDLPGHGESDPQEGKIPMDRMYGDLEALLQEHLGEERPILVGNSLGAWLGMIYAHRHPDELVRLVAVNGGAITNDPGDVTLLPQNRDEARRLVEALRDPANPQVPDFVLDDLVELSDGGPVSRFMADLMGMQKYVMDWMLGEITVPVDLIWGASDTFMPLSYAERLLRGLPRARITTITTCGHIPQNECPEKFIETLDEVLSQDPPEPSPPPAPLAQEPQEVPREVPAE